MLPVSNVISLKGQINVYGPSLEKAPDNVIYIGRAVNMGGWKLPQSKWANPFKIKNNRDVALSLYRNYILETPHLFQSLPELKHKVLACWCYPQSCHGHILLELCNTYC